jgi:hypothetical protein
MKRPDAAVENLRVSAYRIPTDYPESDGTLEWTSTTLVVTEAEGAGSVGIGYTYADTATARLISGHLAELVRGRAVMDVPAAYSRCCRRSEILAAPELLQWRLRRRISPCGPQSTRAQPRTRRFAGRSAGRNRWVWQRRLLLVRSDAAVQSTG